MSLFAPQPSPKTQKSNNSKSNLKKSLFRPHRSQRVAIKYNIAVLSRDSQ